MREKNNRIEMTGKTFGKLTVLSKYSDKSKSGNLKWICQCECGNKTVVIGSKLRSGHTKSCGCLKYSSVAQGYSATRLYRIWRGMHNRCYKKTHDSYRWYGEKGIAVCKEWHEFIPFRKWALESGYDEHLSIDRVSSKGDYEPSNCRWQTQKQQMNNVSSNHLMEYEGKNYTMAEFSEAFHLRYWTVNNRLRAGWSIDRIVLTPENEVSYEI